MIDILTDGGFLSLIIFKLSNTYKKKVQIFFLSHLSEHYFEWTDITFMEDLGLSDKNKIIKIIKLQKQNVISRDDEI